jgi:hypothetical protein
MKKSIMAFLVFLSIILMTSQAFADSCLCVGIGSGGCGDGAVGGSKLKINQVSSSQISYYLANIQARAQFQSEGKAFDSKTGWFCWKGCLQ